MQSNSASLPLDLIEAFQSLPEHLSERLRPILGRTLANAVYGPRLNPGPIVYWTHHAQRTDENPALDVARILAQSLDRPLLVYQGLSQNYRYASDRHHLFQLQSARDLQQSYSSLGLRYAMHLETRSDSSPALVRLARLAGLIVTEDFPGEPTDRWTARIAAMGKAPLLAVDTACVVPMQLVGKAFDRAFSFRDATKKLYRARIEKPWPSLEANAAPYVGPLPFQPVAWDALCLQDLVAQCDIDHGIPPVSDTPGGSTAGYDRWTSFFGGPIHRYAAKRNDPCAQVVSRMSAYLHYGMVSPMRLAREANAKNAEKYLDELLIWRELAYGYCFYRTDFNCLSTLPAWAVRTLREHESDPREHVYSWESLVRGKTQDLLWNACQMSLLRHGELHNNVRMTWGKALLRWTRDAADALRLLIDLNHRFALDGRDPASYGGILWCLGQFDRPFEPEQPILGTVRDRSTSEHANRMKVDAFEEHVSRSIGKRDIRVAVLGAGLAGAMCARTLSDQGIDVTVFEKSRGVGGRCATRRTSDGVLFDHGPPYIVMRDAQWKPFIESWHQDRILSPWAGRVVRIEGQETLDITDQEHRWVGLPGMSSLGKHLVHDLSMRTLHRVSQVQRDGEQYRVRTEQADAAGLTDVPVSNADSADSGLFDVVVWNMPPTQIQPLLPEECTWGDGLKDYSMEPRWVVMVSLDAIWDVPFDGAWIAGESIEWMGRESSKPGREKQGENWMIHASADWSRANLELSPEQACDVILDCVRSIVRTPMPSVVNAAAHRWRYAHAATSVDRAPKRTNCLWDPERRLGACGDWLCKPGVEGALTSGRSMAGRILGWITDDGPRTVKHATYEQLRLFGRTSS